MNAETLCITFAELDGSIRVETQKWASQEIMMHSEDDKLVQHCLEGDSDAFGILVHKYQEMVYAYAFQKIRNDSDAKDIAQEVFLRAYRHLANLRSPHQFRTWLYTIMSNECKRWLTRTSHQRRETGLEEADDEILQIEPEHARRTDDWQVDLEHALAELPEDNRVAVSMFYMSDCSLKEVGEFLGVSANTVKGKLHRARQQLGRTLSQQYEYRLKEHKLEGGFLMQTLNQISQIRRPIIPPSWREQIIRQIPLGIAATLCILVGMLGFLAIPQHQLWPEPEYPAFAIDAEVPKTEAFELVSLVHVSDPIMPLNTPQSQDIVRLAGMSAQPPLSANVPLAGSGQDQADQVDSLSMPTAIPGMQKKNGYFGESCEG